MLTHQVFKGLLSSKEFYGRVIPYIKEDYFTDSDEIVLVRKIKEYSRDYNKMPLPQDIALMTENDMKLSAGETESVQKLLKQIRALDDVSPEILLKETEAWCKSRALENAILRSVDVMRDEEKTDKGVISQLVKDALAVSFMTDLGHDYFKNARERYDYYTTQEEYISTSLKLLDDALGGGLLKQAIYVFMGRTNVGKTLWLCHLATALTRAGKNVLYVSGEMAERMINKRIDANMLNFDMGELNLNLDREDYFKRLKNVYSRGQGTLKTKFYAAGTCNALHLKAYMDELQLKENFKPDVVVLDYLNLFASYRLPGSAMLNSYLYVKAVTEEFRGVIGVEMDTAVVTATQTNRSGASKGKETGMDDAADCIFTEELVQLRDGSIKKIGDIIVGEQIISNDAYKTVILVHHKKQKECVKITLKSGKTIIVSKDHVFPSNHGRLSINDGLRIGMKLNSKNHSSFINKIKHMTEDLWKKLIGVFRKKD